MELLLRGREWINPILSIWLKFLNNFSLSTPTFVNIYCPLFILPNIYNFPMFTFMFTLNIFVACFFYALGLEPVFLVTLTELLLPLLNGRPTVLLWFDNDWLFINKLYETPICGVSHLFYLPTEELILSILLIVFISIADDKLFLCWE